MLPVCQNEAPLDPPTYKDTLAPAPRAPSMTWGVGRAARRWRPAPWSPGPSFRKVRGGGVRVTGTLRSIIAQISPRSFCDIRMKTSCWSDLMPGPLELHPSGRWARRRYRDLVTCSCLPLGKGLYHREQKQIPQTSGLYRHRPGQLSQGSGLRGKARQEAVGMNLVGVHRASVGYGQR